MTITLPEKYEFPDDDLMKRYKYYGSLGYSSAPKANLKVITDFEIYFSNPSKFNDPFDCIPIAKNRDEAKMRRLLDNSIATYPNALEMFLDRHPEYEGLSESELYERALEENTALSSTPEAMRELAEQFKILCLCRDPVNFLMWSHYGNKHQGFVVEFNLDIDLPELGNLIPVRVQYEEERPHIDMVERLADIQMYKNPVWTYEKEDRIVLPGKGGCVAYHPAQLNSVIFGAQVDDKINSEVTTAVEDVNNSKKIDHEVKIYQVKLPDESYKLYIPDHPYFGDPNFKEIT